MSGPSAMFSGDPVLTRRSFLRAGVGVAAGAVASNGLLSRSASGTTTPWDALRSHLSGDLVLPGDANYEVAHQLAFMQFDDHHPQAIAYCESAPDVQTCVSFAQQNGVAVTARSGGHSYAGYSTNEGLVIDVSRMKAVTVNGSTVSVGTGAAAVDVLGALTPSGLALPSGLYPTVGIAGYTQGGGVGWDTRSYGLAADRLIAAEVVLADGRLVRCDATNEPDLYWALRGGGGGNFGIVTKFESSPFPANPMVMCDLSWPWDAAADVMNAWQAWSIGARKELSNSLGVILGDAAPGNAPAIILNSAYLGSTDAATQQVNELISMVGRPPTTNTVTQMSRYDAMMRQYGCSDVTVTQCHRLGTTPDGKVQRTPYSYDRNRIFAKAVPGAGVDAILGTFDKDRRAGQSRVLWLLTIGGQANKVAPSATAFVHRDAQFIFSVKSGLPTGAPAEDEKAAARKWTDEGFAIIDPYSTKEAYQNFLDPKLPDWRQAYYGSNYTRLARVKKAYDPNGFFTFAQSIG